MNIKFGDYLESLEFGYYYREEILKIDWVYLQMECSNGSGAINVKKITFQ